MANYICQGVQGDSTGCSCNCNNGNMNGGSVGGITDSTCPCSCPGGSVSPDTVFGIPCKEFLTLLAIFVLILSLLGDTSLLSKLA